ncbi:MULTISPECIES: hypothetical protein [unclassified Micromonospora]|uniref:hypothetical protein n=1 Tax=unclassified Micromonospora TaxID=2617518 RepID=UPI001C5E9A09|nr:hypothetical protein [Micromonospora sp. RL09-050-HVF-A]MBW4704862.1 hypothetical protein [Micromonospora sp. RL09-050-HVF-A]
MSPLLAVFLVLVLGATSYAAGRLHGQLSYRIGYRFGYRQGYFDGDRGAWNRRRRDAQAVLASALAVPAGTAAAAGPSAPAVRQGTTYAGSSFTAPPGPVAVRPAPMAAPPGPVAARPGPVTGRHPTGTLVRRTG